MSEFGVVETEMPTGAMLDSDHFATTEVTMESASRDNTDYDDYLLKVGTPIALIVDGTEYKPVRRDVVASSSYDSSAGETTVTMTNSVQPFVVGDICQAYDGVDGTAASLGAITEVDYTNLQLVFGTDVESEAVATYYLDVTETGQGVTAYLLLEPCDMWSSRQKAAIDKTTRAVVHGVINEDDITQVQDEDAQLEADLSALILLV